MPFLQNCQMVNPFNYNIVIDQCQPEIVFIPNYEGFNTITLLYYKQINRLASGSIKFPKDFLIPSFIGNIFAI